MIQPQWINVQHNLSFPAIAIIYRCSVPFATINYLGPLIGETTGLMALLFSCFTYHMPHSFYWIIEFMRAHLYPSALQVGGVLSSRSGWAGGCQTCGTHISVTAWRILSIPSSVELSRPLIVHSHSHFPICPIWACPWTKKLPNLAQIGSRHCGTQISETTGWIEPIKSCRVLQRNPANHWGKTTTGSALDGAVLDFTQILAYLVHNMSRSQLYLGFGHFGRIPSIFDQ